MAVAEAIVEARPMNPADAIARANSLTAEFFPTANPSSDLPESLEALHFSLALIEVLRMGDAFRREYSDGLVAIDQLEDLAILSGLAIVAKARHDTPEGSAEIYG